MRLFLLAVSWGYVSNFRKQDACVIMGLSYAMLNLDQLGGITASLWRFLLPGIVTQAGLTQVIYLVAHHHFYCAFIDTPLGYKIKENHEKAFVCIGINMRR